MYLELVFASTMKGQNIWYVCHTMAHAVTTLTNFSSKCGGAPKSKFFSSSKTVNKS